MERLTCDTITATSSCSYAVSVFLPQVQTLDSFLSVLDFSIFFKIKINNNFSQSYS